MPRHLLYATGSNSGGQLSLGHIDDVHRLARVLHQPHVDKDHPGPSTPSLAAFPPAGWTVQQLASGANHSVAILQPLNGDEDEDGDGDGERQLWLCGDSTQGQLGQALYDGQRSATSFVRHDAHRPHIVACGWDTTYLVSRPAAPGADDVLTSWGTTNDFGQLGVPPSPKGKGKAEHQVVHLSALRSLPRHLTEGRGGARIRSIQASPRHVLFALSFDVGVTAGPSTKTRAHCLLGFGASRHGQLGPRHAAAKVLREPALLQAWLEEVEQGRGEKLSIAVGKEHSAILVPPGWRAISFESGGEGASAPDNLGTSTTQLHLLGSNKNDQLDVASLVSRLDGGGASIEDVQCTWNGTFVLCRLAGGGGARLFASGKDDAGQLGPHLSTSTAGLRETDLSILQPSITPRLICGSEHLLLLLLCGASRSSSSPPQTQKQNETQTSVYGWGWNEHGNLATGDEVNSRLPVLIWPAEAQGRAINAWAGCGTTFLLVEADVEAQVEVEDDVEATRDS